MSGRIREVTRVRGQGRSTTSSVLRKLQEREIRIIDIPRLEFGTQRVNRLWTGKRTPDFDPPSTTEHHPNNQPSATHLATSREPVLVPTLPVIHGIDGVAADKRSNPVDLDKLDAKIWNLNEKRQSGKKLDATELAFLTEQQTQLEGIASPHSERVENLLATIVALRKNDFIEFALWERLASNPITPDSQLGQSIKVAIDRQEEIAQRVRLSIHTEIPEDGVAFENDPKMQKALDLIRTTEALITHSIYHAKRESDTQLTITIKRLSDGSAEITFSDTGTGMTRRDMQNIGYPAYLTGNFPDEINDAINNMSSGKWLPLYYKTEEDVGTSWRFVIPASDLKGPKLEAEKLADQKKRYEVEGYRILPASNGR